MGIDTVNDLPRRAQYTAGAAQTTFDYGWPIFVEADLVVYVNDTLKALSTHYTVAGETDDAGGTITFLTPLAGGEVVTIYSSLAIARDTDFQQNGPWSSSSFNDQLDRLTIIARELADKIARCIRWPFTASQTSAGLELSPIANWYGKFLRVSSTGILEAAEVVSSVVALTQSVIGALLNPQTAAEVTVGVNPPNKWYRERNILRYATNTTPGTTDMASALQTAINVTAVGGYGDVTVPYGLYKIGSHIYFHYDVTNNPAFPSTAGQWGMVNIVGEGWTEYTAYNQGISQGSVLDIGANQFKIGKGVQGTRGVRFRNCTVRGNSTTYLIKYDFVSKACGFTDFSLFQAGIGGGFEMDNCFLVYFDNVAIQTTNAGNTGIGAYVHNSVQAAGLYDFRGVSVIDFQKNFVLGQENTSGASMSGITMTGCQGNGGDYNLILGNGVKAAVIDTFHNEAPSTIGVLCAWGAAQIRFEGLYSSVCGASADYMSIGKVSGTATERLTKSISVVNSTFTGIAAGRVGINVYSTTSTADREIAYCSFLGANSGDTAIAVENVVQHGLKIGPNIYVTVATEVSNPTRVDILRASDTLGLTTQYAPVAFRNAGQQFVAGVVTFTSTDATPTVAGGDVFITAGTTAITDFDDGVLGQTIRIQATDNITITHNAAIIKLSGAGSFAMTADDTLTLTMFVDQIWQEVSRTVI
jgi:hypothetical protein